MRRGRAAGQAIVELALVLPILLILLMGVIDAGRLLFTYIALEDAVQEGAIFSAHEPSPPDAIRDRVTSSSNHLEVVNATVPDPVCTPPSGGNPGTISVTASYPVEMLTPVGRQIFGSTITMTATFIATNFKGSCT